MIRHRRDRATPATTATTTTTFHPNRVIVVRDVRLFPFFFPSARVVGCFATYVTACRSILERRAHTTLRFSRSLISAGRISVLSATAPLHRNLRPVSVLPFFHEQSRICAVSRRRIFFEKRSDTERERERERERRLGLERRDVFSREREKEARDQVVEWIVGSLD